MKPKSVGYLVLLGILCSVLTGCDVWTSSATGTPPVVQLMPELDGYDVVEGDQVQEYVATLAQGAALLSGNPEMVVLIEKVDGTIACYQDAGAVNLRIFSQEDYPLSSGAIAIADRDRLTDPGTFLRCAGGGMAPSSAQPALDPCAHSYTLERDDNEIYIIYVGTTQEICGTFCEHLEGCTEH